MTRFQALSLFALAGVLCGAKKPLTVKVVYGRSSCPPCERLYGMVQDLGGKWQIEPTFVKPKSVDEYPTVLYSDGSKDAGGRIFSGKATVTSQTIRMIKYTGVGVGE